MKSFIPQELISYKEKKNLDVDRMINCDNQLADIIFDFLKLDSKY